MRTQIEYIANYLGVDITNPLCLTDISEIKDIERFKYFMKSNIKNIRLDYLNPLQKLNELKKMFEEEINVGRIEKAENHAFLLAEKFRTLKPLIKRMFEEFKDPLIENFEKTDGTKYFESYELNTLKKIGNLRKLVFFDDNMTLEDKITKEFTQIVYQTSTKPPQISMNDIPNDKRLASTIKTALNQF